MSTYRGGKNGGNYYSNLTQPIDIDLNFVVDSTNGNGLGIRNIKSNGWVRNVYMNTSATPAAGNPNPAAGFCLIQLKQNFNIYLAGFSGFASPLSGSSVTSVTSGNAYVIVSLGTATLAQWQSVGVPKGLTPSVGMSFIASSSGTIGGSAAVQAPSHSGIYAVEVVGDPNQSINNSSIAANGGAWILIQFLNASGVPTAPANGSVCGMVIRMDQSSADPQMMNGDGT